MSNRTNIREQLGLRSVINVSGTMTALGASIAVPEAIEAISAILPEFVQVDELQRKASAVIARLTKSEAGYVTASASSGISTTVAGTMTGNDLAKIHQLPRSGDMRTEVLIQIGHMVSYGAPVEQAIRLTGATVVPVGTMNFSDAAELEGSITERTTAAVYVVSHHTAQFGQIPLTDFARICHTYKVPVIADVASEYDLQGFLADGADLAIYSAHKFLGGPTAGIVAGRKDLVHAAYLQNIGIGRGMKVGKEGIVGTIAALEAWEQRDHKGIRRREQEYLDLWLTKLNNRDGVEATTIPDPTNNPLERLKIVVEPSRAGVTAWELADRLANGTPSIIVRNHEVSRGYFYLDPCNLHNGEAEIVAERLALLLDEAERSPKRGQENFSEFQIRQAAHQKDWPS